MTRVQVVADIVTGTVTVYLADADGPVTTLVRDEVDAILQQFAVPDAISETTLQAVAHNINVELTVYATAPVPLDQDVLDTMVEYFATIPIGGTDVGSGGFVFLDRIIGAIVREIPSVQHVEITSPGADVAMAEGEVAVLTTVVGDITVLPVV